MLKIKAFGLYLLRYLVLLFAVGPIVGIILVWTWMAINALSPDRNGVMDRGNLLIGLLMVGGGLGIALELVLTPILRRGSGRRHWAGRNRD